MKVKMNCITQPLITNIVHGQTEIWEENISPEEYIIYAARVSSENRHNNETAPKLLKYLIEHKHWSPFEMISIGIEIETSRAIAQQILRHHSFSFQEFSQRYAAVTDMEPVQLRYQAEKNRQSSTDVMDDALCSRVVGGAIYHCNEVYKYLISKGVARECARMVLPLTTKTTIVMHGTLRSWIHFFEQRCSEHAQLEIREIAFCARELISLECPWTAEALGWINK